MSAHSFIPQMDPRSSYLAHQNEIDRAIRRVLDSNSYILGNETEAFEWEFAEYIGVSFGVGVGSGTDALCIALRACSIQPGDEVITVAHTAVATVAAIEIAGATPVLIDIDPRTYTLAPSLIEAAITPRTKAVVPVHLYGHPADMQPILSIARVFGLHVIEDCAQAHGAEYHGKKVGSFGNAAAFSFYPTKNLGAVGDAGMVLCSHAEVAQVARQLRQYGWKRKHVSEHPGYNMRLDELQAAILRVKLKYLDQDNHTRRQVAARYSACLKDTALLTPTEDQSATHCYHQYVIRHPDRDRLQKYLAEKSVGTNIHYPVPIHLQPAYQNRIAFPDKLKITEQVALGILSLPMYPALNEATVNYIIDTISSWLAEWSNRRSQDNVSLPNR